MTGTALFVGDVSLDTTVLAARMPEPDEKVLAELCIDSAGGVAANSAVACALAGAVVTFYSTVADDAPGATVTADLGRYGLDVHLETAGAATARAIVMLDEHGEKRLFLYRGHRMYPSIAQVERLPLEGVGWLHTAAYDRDGAATIIRRCREASIPWSIDLEPATIPADISDLAPHLDGCDVAIINARASAMIGADAVARLFELGVLFVIETLGPGGARLHGSRGFVRTVEPEPLEGPVRDTTGAGDAFAGWLVAERLRGSSTEAAVRSAVRAASRSVQSIGTLSSYPTRADLIGAPSSPTKERQQ